MGKHSQHEIKNNNEVLYKIEILFKIYQIAEAF